MPHTAEQQLNRIVQLTAELSRREAQGGEPPAIGSVAQSFGVSPKQVLTDLRILTEAADDSENTWLASLKVYQEGDRIAVTSRGPYQRPIRFTAEELLALQVALATDPDRPASLLEQLAELANAPAPATEQLSPAPFAADHEANIVNLARLAAATRRKMRLVYAAEGAVEPSIRVVDPQRVVYAGGVFYIVAWSVEQQDVRRFRAERVIEAQLLGETSALSLSSSPPVPLSANAERGDEEVIFTAPKEALEEVRVRFSPVIARWLAEKYPDGERQKDGSFVVTLQSARIDWAVRTVLQYGPEAEILGPPAYREAMRRAL